MPTESFYNATEGSGKKLHTVMRTIGANDVHDETILAGEQALPAYTAPTGAATSIATANDHPFQLMAGASLNVFLRRLMVWQAGLATTAAIAQFAIFRVTTAGTGGSVVTTRPLDIGDPTSGATAMTLPTAKGTEGARMWIGSAGLMQTAPTAGASTLLLDLEFDRWRSKALVIPAGTTNGIVLKNLAAYAGASIFATAFFSEAAFL